jgi:hypothetical protein
MRPIRSAFELLTAVAFLLVITSCSQEQADPQGDAADYETALRGTVEIYVDEQIIDLMQPAKELYDEQNPDAHVTLVPGTALEIADDILEHRIRGAVIARDWLPGEDSAAQRDRGSDGFPVTEIAKDALVFFTAPDFPLDTLNADDIQTWLVGGTVAPDVYPALSRRPTFVVPGTASSVYGNVMNLITHGKQPARGLVAALGTADAVRTSVLNDRSLIGVGYLSQFVRDSGVKLLRVSFVDSNGTYIRPKPVHAAYLIMGRYPYPVPIRMILKDRASPHSLPSGFAVFMARDGNAQRTFFDWGIEPGYARIELNIPE